jgi:carbamoyl-phosphate synthase large subunit
VKITVAVTGAGSLFGQGMIRSLKMSDLDCRLVGLDFFPHAVGLYWSDVAYLLPDVLKEGISEDDYLETLIRVLKTEGAQVVFPGTDFEISIFARHRSMLARETACRVVVSPQEVVELCDDKWRTCEFLKANGFSHPPSLIDLGQLDPFVEDVGFPLIVKPRRGYRSNGLTLVTRRDDLGPAIHKAGPAPIVQRAIGSDQEEFTCGTVVLDGECLGTIAMRRDLRDGNTFRAYLEDQPGLESAVREMALALKPFGCVNFQLRLDNTRPVVFEINSRCSGTTIMRALAGFNEVEAIVRWLVLGDKMPLRHKKTGVFLRHWEELFVPWEEYHRMEAGGRS